MIYEYETTKEDKEKDEEDCITDTDILHAADRGKEKPGVMMEMDEAQHLEEDGDDISRACTTLLYFSVLQWTLL